MLKLTDDRSDGGLVFLPLEVAACNHSLVLLPAGRTCTRHHAQCERASADNYTCWCVGAGDAVAAGAGAAVASWNFRRAELEEALLHAANNLTLLRCPGCAEPWCGAAGEDVDAPWGAVRHAVLAVQLLCMFAAVSLAWVVFRQRKCKTIAAGMWTILETILLGEFLLYATVPVQLLAPSVVRCLLEAWLREIGFVVCYGAIILKLYRILIEFRTRKAHRWVVRDKDLLKYLSGMVVVAHGYMAAWTASTLNFLADGHELVARGRTPDGRPFLTCRALWWDYVTEAGELLMVAFGLHLGFASRNAASPYEERRWLCAALCIELVGSAAYYAARAALWSQLEPRAFLLLSLARSQLTGTGCLLCVFLPKLWYEQRRSASRGQCLAQELSARLPLDAFRPVDGVPTDADLAEINLADMNPDDIRAELKRLYTQLEILKNKTIRADNPHISKRRGGRKVAHRRFSLQKKGSREKALHHRQQSQQQQDATETEVSRTPEDSVCSNEGPSAVYAELDRDLRP
ncbi:probable G-protein coupled receptor 158 [Schistocerca nitens]|uniref:probable G-protein coupled receptor 158 n=1 Tax=Schistocerca nitens TaxID=7011 RepID=UPI002117457E|nr:probable G-protein coupled receptor 158 [Schistocerca nitens]